MAQFSFRLPDEMKEKLEEIAKEERRSVSFILKDAIEYYLRGKEPVNAIAEADSNAAE